MDLTGLPFWILALAAVILIAIIIFALESWKPWKVELGRDHDGLLQEREAETESPEMHQ